jgi:hypothetical protein
MALQKLPKQEYILQHTLLSCTPVTVATIGGILHLAKLYVFFMLILKQIHFRH